MATKQKNRGDSEPLGLSAGYLKELKHCVNIATSTIESRHNTDNPDLLEVEQINPSGDHAIEWLIAEISEVDGGPEVLQEVMRRIREGSGARGVQDKILKQKAAGQLSEPKVGVIAIFIAILRNFNGSGRWAV